MLRKLLNKDNVLRIQIFLMIFLSAGCVTSNGVMSVPIQMVLWGGLVFSLISKMKFNPNAKEFLYTFLLILVVLLSDTINGERFTLTILMSVMILASYCFVGKVSYEKFAISYVDVMCFLSITSLIGYTICLLRPSLQTFNLTETSSRFVANFYIYVHSPGTIRNFGLFWEPGAFQAFLSVALLIEIYRRDPSILRFLLLIVTSVTTFSTSGYITIALIALLVLMRYGKSTKKLKKSVIVLLPIAISLLVVNETFLASGSSSVFGKLTAFTEDKAYLEGSSRTRASVRYFSVIKPLEEFANSPILGCGYENLQKATERYTGNMNTCTFVNFFAIHGILFGLIMMVGYVRYCRRIEPSFALAIYLFILFFIITMSENLMRIPLFIILPLYGITGIGTKSVSQNYLPQQHN